MEIFLNKKQGCTSNALLNANKGKFCFVKLYKSITLVILLISISTGIKAQTWGQICKSLPTTTSLSVDEFGRSVAIDGDYAVVSVHW